VDGGDAMIIDLILGFAGGLFIMFLFLSHSGH
jgi:hypothetical protein